MPPRRPGPAGVGRALRDHRSAEEVDARQAGERADARHRARRHAGARRGVDRRGPDVRSSAPTRSSSAAAPTAVHRHRMSASTIVSGQNRWQVVGVFEADGGVAETEIWCDARDAAGRLSARQHVPVGAGAARVGRRASTTFRDWLTANPQLNVQIRRENEYYAGQSQALTTADSGDRLSASPG